SQSCGNRRRPRPARTRSTPAWSGSARCPGSSAAPPGGPSPGCSARSARCQATWTSSPHSWSPSRCASSTGRSHRRRPWPERPHSRGAGTAGPAAGVYVELPVQVVRCHRGALDVPARASPAPRRIPRGLARLGGLPHREVAGILLARARGLALVQLVELLTGQEAVVLDRGGLGVDVAVGGVAVAVIDDALHVLDH